MLKMLYICTHNRCRSILSEAISNQKGQGLIIARSAGSQPAGEVHPLSLKYLTELGYSTEKLASQSWDEFENFSPDIVITVCDSAAQESCPLWFGKATQLHWQLADPSKEVGTEEQTKWAFINTIEVIEKRVNLLVEKANLPIDQVVDSLMTVGAELHNTKK